ncbi:MAG TPA: flagellar hook-basal body complex protein FliE [Solirubrobacteraceae bacterium]|nr:flagellar hook-basal body complex protein FliE [Solirubrobacteraceae bacterium]
MPPMPIDPSFAVTGGEWSIGGLGDAAIPAPADGAQNADGSQFGGMLAEQIGQLERLQTDAAQGARELAAGTASDPTEVIMAVERARLSMQLASQIRTKAVEAVQDIFHTQI